MESTSVYCGDGERERFPELQTKVTLEPEVGALLGVQEVGPAARAQALGRAVAQFIADLKVQGQEHWARQLEGVPARLAAVSVGVRQ
jgi:hypothetical protein